MNIFDIIGPVMIGPSSSHTAGAARAGYIARKLLGRTPVKAKIGLYGSFTATYFGHGTDRAILGGILGFSPADTNIKDSFDIAKQQGLEYEFYALDLKSAHPNTTKITLYDKDNNSISVMVSSVGGGVIEVNEINDNKVSFSANYATTVIFNHDKAGVVANVTSVLADYKINIAFMKLFRDTDGGNAIMVIESDELVKKEVIDELGKIVNVTKVIYIDPFSM